MSGLVDADVEVVLVLLRERERDAGAMEHRREIGASLERRGADRDRDGDTNRLDDERACDAGVDPVRGLPDGVRAGRVDQHAELVLADASNDLGVGELPPKPVRELDQYRVTAGRAEDLVQLGEAVDVDEQERARLARAEGGIDRAPEPVPVGGARRLVVRAGVLQLGQVPADARRHAEQKGCKHEEEEHEKPFEDRRGQERGALPCCRDRAVVLLEHRHAGRRRVAEDERQGGAERAPVLKRRGPDGRARDPAERLPYFGLCHGARRSLRGRVDEAPARVVERDAEDPLEKDPLAEEPIERVAARSRRRAGEVGRPERVLEHRLGGEAGSLDRASLRLPGARGPEEARDRDRRNRQAERGAHGEAHDELRWTLGCARWTERAHGSGNGERRRREQVSGRHGHADPIGADLDLRHDRAGIEPEVQLGLCIRRSFRRRCGRGRSVELGRKRSIGHVGRNR